MRTHRRSKEIKQYHEKGMNKTKLHALSRILTMNEVKYLFKLSWFINQNMFIRSLEAFAYKHCKNTLKEVRMVH